MNSPEEYEEEAERNGKTSLRFEPIVELKKWLCELDDRVSGELARLRRFCLSFAVLVVLGASLLIVFGWFNLRSDFGEHDKDIGLQFAALSSQIKTLRETSIEIKARVELLSAVETRLTNQVNAVSVDFGESGRQMAGFTEQLERLKAQNHDLTILTEMLLRNYSQTTNTITGMVDSIAKLETGTDEMARLSKELATVSASVNELPAMANRINTLEKQTNMITILGNQSFQLYGQILELQADIKSLSGRTEDLEAAVFLPGK